MKIGIDGANIRAGGGVTHLREILRVNDPKDQGVDEIVIWSGSKTLSQLEERPWLEKVNVPLLNRSLLLRTFWQFFLLEREINKYDVDVLFIPGGIYFGRFKPFTTMSQNLLPFDDKERKRFGLSFLGIKLLVIKFLQRSTFKRADGIIFLTETAQEITQKQIDPITAQTTVVYHGVSDDFKKDPREQEPISQYKSDKPFRWLYVSLVSQYKHQWHVVEAIDLLKKEGYPVTLELIGNSHKQAIKRLTEAIDQVDPESHFISYPGPVPYHQLGDYYHNADGFIFASSCETFGQILVEAMSSGLPIACSNRSVMPEVLGNAGEYFDPEDPDSISQALIRLMEDPDLRKQHAWNAYHRSQSFTWEKCAGETFSFIRDIYERSAEKNEKS